jgi:hypothetical protein
MKKTTETVTFRLSAPLIESLREEAKEDHVSLNTLMTQLIISHEKWGKHSRKGCFMPIPKDFLMLLMDQLSVDEIKKIVQTKTETCKDVITLFRAKYDLDSFLDFIETWFRVSAFPYRKDVTENKIKLVIMHVMGEKWSLFLSLLLQYNLEALTKEKILVETTDQTVTVEIPIKPSMFIK